MTLVAKPRYTGHLEYRIFVTCPSPDGPFLVYLGTTLAAPSRQPASLDEIDGDRFWIPVDNPDRDWPIDAVKVDAACAYLNITLAGGEQINVPVSVPPHDDYCQGALVHDVRTTASWTWHRLAMLLEKYNS